MSQPPDLPPDWSQRYAAWRQGALAAIRAGDKRVYESYPHVELGERPLCRPRQPLARTRVALVSSGGLSLPGQQPFDADDPEGDPGLRVIPGTGPLASWRIDHGHYDPAAASQDYNAVFPLDRLRELAEAGEIGAVAPRHVSFVGYQTDAARLLTDLAPGMLDVLRSDGVDAALLVPVWPICHQSVGLVARYLEDAGIATTTLANMRTPLLRVKPPRVLLRRGPRGQTVGEPGDTEGQRAVVRAALRLLETSLEPGLINAWEV